MLLGGKSLKKLIMVSAHIIESVYAFLAFKGCLVDL